MLSGASCAKVPLRLALVGVCCLASLSLITSYALGQQKDSRNIVRERIAVPVDGPVEDVLRFDTDLVAVDVRAQRFKIDPALVSAPLITTLVDATGLVIYMLIAKSILSSLR